MPLGTLRKAVTVTTGQKITYVTDAADTAANRDTIVRLAHNADLLFIEAPFAKADVQLAAQRSHLTTDSAGRLARAAGVPGRTVSLFAPLFGSRAADAGRGHVELCRLRFP